jgi:hypothetical protein
MSLWDWEFDPRPRYGLVDNYTATDGLWGLCADVDGLYVVPEPPLRERVTLVGCALAGALADAVARSAPTRVGDVLLQAVPEQPMRLWSLLNATVVGQHRHESNPTLVDIVLEAVVDDDGDELEPGVTGFLVTTKADGVSTCRATRSLFRQRDQPPDRPLALIGCQPMGPLGDVGTVDLVPLDRHGRPAGGWQLRLDILDVRPSARAAGLVDITVRNGVIDGPSPAARGIWQLWFDGGPDVPNLWAAYDTAVRWEWLSAAVRHERRAQSGSTFHLDGRYVTDRPGFYCALGEAINGPGGWFGADEFWLHDRTVFGERGAPFTLVWHDADVARRHLPLTAETAVDGYDMMAGVVAQLREDGVDVIRLPAVG